MLLLVFVLVFAAAFGCFQASNLVVVDGKEYSVTVLTVATERTDGFERYRRSAEKFGIRVRVLGMDEKWTGGDVKRSAGGGIKVKHYKRALDEMRPHTNQICLLTDAYDVVFVDGLAVMVRKFLGLGVRIVFGAEVTCWPDWSLAERYPSEDADSYSYLNSGAIMGYAADLWAVIDEENRTNAIRDADDDQLFFTRIYLDELLRKNYAIRLDGRNELITNLYGIQEHIGVEIGADVVRVRNTFFQTTPSIIHGNGRSKQRLNSITNYVPDVWSPTRQCIECRERVAFMDDDTSREKPLVLLNLFVEEPTAFLDEFFDSILDLKYPKSRLHLCLHNAIDYHARTVRQFVDRAKSLYADVNELGTELDERSARNLAFGRCEEIGCDYVFVIDADARLDEPYTIEMLIEQNRTILAPFLRETTPGSLIANFWGALNSDGYYSRSFDYLAILNGSRSGVWNVPYIAKSYLINMTRFRDTDFEPYTTGTDLDPDMALASNFRDRDIFMFVTNRYHFGHLINNREFNTSNVSPDFYTLRTNRDEWTKRYVHEEYAEMLAGDRKPLEPCTDVYWFPIATERMCSELIAIVESNGKWSAGTHYDERISGGYEAVPTRDIHMRQVGLHDQWNYFLSQFVNPLAKKVYLGYNDDASAIMNFVVRYKPDEQASLRPHHDSSTYTINIALNQKSVDYEGGGCRFVRYNCSVINTKLGWMMMHPGRLTHLHEGLAVTAGIRYIMISFVNP